MTEESRALVTAESGQMALIAQATRTAQALADFLPGGTAIPEETRRAMALLAVQHGLDPFLGEVYAIPERRKDPRTGEWGPTGKYVLGIGRGGWLRNAERSGLYRGHGFRSLTPEEREGLKIQPGDIGMVCFVNKVANVHDGGHRGYEVEGFGVVRNDEKSKMDHYKLARKRAFVDALRMAFPMQVPLIGEERMQIRVVDEETGEVLGNGHEPGTGLEETAATGEFRETEAPPMAAQEPAQAPITEQAQTAPDSQTELPWNAAELPVQAQERPRTLEVQSSEAFCAAVAQWLPRYAHASKPGQVNTFAMMASLRKAGITTLSDPRAWPHLCRRNDEEGGAAA